MRKFNVYLGGLMIDSVFMIDQLDADAVKKSLIEHDGYDAGIDVIDDENDPNVGKVFEVMHNGEHIARVLHAQPTYIGEVRQSLIEDDHYPEDITISIVS